MGGRRRLEREDTAGLTVAQGRKFGLTVGGAFLALSGILAWRGHATASVVTGSLGAVLAMAGLVVPRRLGPVERAWMGLAHAISKVTTPVLMTLIYYVVLTPAGWLVRAFGHRPLRREAEGGSYWVERDSPGGDLERQF